MKSITPRKTHQPSGPRRPLLRPLVSSSLLCLLGIHSPVHAENARPADSFVDSIGVNTHFGTWGNNVTIKTKLKDSGIRYIRDNNVSAATLSDLYTNYGNIKALLAFDGSGMSLSERVTALGQLYTIGVQGRNEPDSFTNFTYNGISDNRSQLDFKATRAYQHDIYNAVKADAAAKLKAVVSPSFNDTNFTATLASIPFDKISVHAYSNRNPGWWSLPMERLPDAAKMVSSGQSPQGIWVTETGYQTAYNTTATASNSITYAAHGKYVPRIFATNFNKNIERTFVYQFYNDGWTFNEKNFGLIKDSANSYAEKPAYWAVKNLITLLKDDAPGGPAYIPGALNYTITPNPANPNIKSTLLRKRNGDYYLLLWQEVVSCTPGVAPSTQPTDISVSAAPVTLNFGTTASSVTTYTNLANQNYTTGSTLTNIASIPLNVPDEIIIVKITLPGGVNPGSGAPAPTAGSDLVITKVWSTPANPIAGEPTSFHMTMKNKGTVATTATTQVRFASGPNPIVADLTAPALPAGGSQTLETDTITTLAAGFNTIRVNCDNSSTVAETDELNNMSTLTVPVLADRFTATCDAIGPDWTSSGNWSVQTVSPRTFFQNTEKWAGGTLTHSFSSAVVANWRLDFEYNWRWGGPLAGGGAFDLKVFADVLDGSNNGYRILVHQGDSNNPLNTPKQIELFKVTGGAPAATAMGTGVGYDECGDATLLDFKKVSFIYDRATQSISVYIDLNGDGALEQVIAPVRDTTTPTVSFTKLVLGARDDQGATASPKFDNVCFSQGMMTLVPAPFFVDSFIDDLAQWTADPNWTVITTAGQKYAHNPLNGSPGTMTHPFVAPLTNGWSLGFDYDFEWGGGTSQGNLYGNDQPTVTAAMLDSTNNGYRIVVQQGDSGQAANNNKVIKIYKVTLGANGTQPLAQGIGYNMPGWHNSGSPKFKRVILTYNRKMQTLSAFIDLNGDGTFEQVVAPIQDTANVFSFTQLQLGGSTGNQGEVKPAFDNIEVGLIQ